MLTEAEKLQAARILGLTYIDVNDKIFNLGATYFTDEVNNQIRELLSEWADGAGSDTTRIRPKESNFGAEIDPAIRRNQIRSELAGLMYFVGGSFGLAANNQIKLVRG